MTLGLRTKAVAASVSSCLFLASCAHVPADVSPVRALSPSLPIVSNRLCGVIDHRLVEAASKLVSVAPRLAKVWPGFWPANQAVILYNPGEVAILVSSQAPPAPFTAVPANLLPGELQGRLHLACGALPGLTGNFDTDYAVGETRAIAVKLEDTAYETLEVLFHEGFHKFQETEFARTTGADSLALLEEPRVDPDIIRQAGFVASMELERRILAAAVAAPSHRQMKALARQYLAVRWKRTGALPTEVRHSELNIERKEGSASIVGHESAALAYGRSLDQPYAQLRMFLSEPPASLPAGDSAYARFRMRAFGSGAAIAWMLTRMGIDWRSRLQGGASFETLLSEVVGFDAPALAEDGAAQFGLASLLAYAEKWRAATPEVTADDFYREGKVRLTVEFPASGTDAPSYSVSHAGLAAQPENNLLIFMQAHTAKLNYGPVTLNAEGHPILVDQRGMPTIYSFTLMLDSLPQVQGFGTDRNGEYGTVVGEGLSIKIDAPATIERNGDSIKIKVASR